ncbi:MAG: MBL fold metallo-hydrolase [Syntrophales bacterium]|jgi:ribonuclease BN (tRNA processing enzyme)|nr:MBL fold metallo-hydrolase [Syntrophales bacterium]MCK9528428.1 MBL fold metallo-hydrolase [Syntrophales bacterium]MDX9922451.1 MBL fold metallo-hydrolase [Syntrophales bacterium]
MALEYSLVVNGVGHAFLREFGCPCERCRRSGPDANTSLSIVGRDRKTRRVAWHALIDVGMGVNTSLCNNFDPVDARLDWLLLTHWHPDHTLDLNRLGESARRTAFRQGVKFKKIPTWCRNGTAQWIQKNHSYEWYRHLFPQHTAEASPPGSVLDALPIEVPDLRITPVTVSHRTADINPADFKKKLFCSASFVIETHAKKAVVLWDADGFNDWIVSPESAEQERAAALVSDADYLFIDCFDWDTEKVQGHGTGHLSFRTVRKYAAAMRPRQTFPVHMSGHEDGAGNPGWGWSDDRWTEEAQAVWAAEGLPGSVRVPAIGEVMPLH